MLKVPIPSPFTEKREVKLEIKRKIDSLFFVILSCFFFHFFSFFRGFLSKKRLVFFVVDNKQEECKKDLFLRSLFSGQKLKTFFVFTCFYTVTDKPNL